MLYEYSPILEELINEEGSYALEEDGDGDWFLDETEVWAWGPIEITNDDGYCRVIVADADGNVDKSMFWPTFFCFSLVGILIIFMFVCFSHDFL